MPDGIKSQGLGWGEFPRNFLRQELALQENSTWETLITMWGRVFRVRNRGEESEEWLCGVSCGHGEGGFRGVSLAYQG